MSTKETIIQIGDKLIRSKGFNAFSFADISKALGLKNASIHYHFPTKTDLGVAIIQSHAAKLDKLIEASVNESPLQQLERFLSIYNHTKAEDKICIVGAFCSCLDSLDNNMVLATKKLVEKILSWLIQILEKGKAQRVFYFEIPARTQALMVASTMLASVQVSRLTQENDFYSIRENIINGLTHHE